MKTDRDKLCPKQDATKFHRIGTQKQENKLKENGMEWYLHTVNTCSVLKWQIRPKGTNVIKTTSDYIKSSITKERRRAAVKIKNI